MKKYDYILLVKKYRQQILQCSALAAAVMCACGLSYMAGRYSGKQENPAKTSADSKTAETMPQYTDLAPGSPSFVFPPGAAYRDATPSNVDIMDSQVLNLAYLYEDGADSTDPSASYGGQLYDMLALKDAAWMSGLYDLYNYTPQQLASLLGLPETAVTSVSGLIPEFRNISVRFVNGDQQETGSTSNAREIISILNTLHYYGVLKDLEAMKDCADKLWNASHKYSVSIGGIYYCDGSCLVETGAANRSDAEDMAMAAKADAAANGTSDAADGEGTEESQPDSPQADQVSGETSGPVATVPPDRQALPAAADGPDEGAADGPGEGAADGPGEGAADELATASASDAMSIGAETSDADAESGFRTCPGHVDCSVLALVKGTSEADSLYLAADSLQAVRNSGWAGWNADTRNLTSRLLAQDWFLEYGLYTADYPVKGLLDSQEIELYMKLVPEDASRQRKDFVRYALTSVGKIPYYWGGKPSAPGYTGNGFGSLTVPDEDGRLLKGLDCSGWINWVYWSVTGRGLGAQSTSTLLGSGTPVARNELMPGDICIRLNPMAHVVVFLGWTAEGNMLCIQETTGSSNNVEVGTVTGDWESYRRILE